MFFGLAKSMDLGNLLRTGRDGRTSATTPGFAGHVAWWNNTEVRLVGESSPRSAMGAGSLPSSPSRSVISKSCRVLRGKTTSAWPRPAAARATSDHVRVEVSNGASRLRINAPLSDSLGNANFGIMSKRR